MKMLKSMKIMAAMTLLGLVAGCGESEQVADSRPAIRSLADLKGRTCAVVVGSALDTCITKAQEGVILASFNDYPSSIEAVRIGKVDALPMDTVVVKQWVAANPDDFQLAFSFGSNPMGYMFPKGSPLTAKVDGVLADLKRTGELERIVSKWCSASDLATVPEEEVKMPPSFTGKGGELRVAVCAVAPPGVFVRQEKIVGFEVDIMRRVAAALDMTFEPVNMEVGAMVPAVESGKVTMGGGCITITPERAQRVDFTDSYLDLGYAVLVRKAGSVGGNDKTIRTPADLKGRHVAHMSSDFHRGELRNLQPDVKFDPYSEYQFAIESLRKRKLDAISLGDTIADIWMAQFPGEFKVAFEYAKDHCAYLFPKGCKHAARINAELRKMNAEGLCRKVMGKWKEGAKAKVVPKLPEWQAPEGAPVLRVAAATQVEPWCFVANDRIVGADVELLTILAERLGCRLELKGYSFGGMVDAVNSRRADVGCGGVYVGGGVFPTLDVSEYVDDISMCVMVRNEGAKRKSAGGIAAWFKSVGESFHRTFVVESRWKMMARGLGITLLITFCASVLGTLLAFPVWLGRTAKNRFVRAVAKSYVAVLQGTPVLVLLMVLFYIVFGSVDIDGIWVAVFGFALNASAYLGEMLRSGIQSVPQGQTEAALALGYRSRQAFMRFVLPQAVRAILPVYRGELVSLLKATSIVGYIAINDLNKASDLIRSRTYESFFPILTTAFIYFMAAWLLSLALDRFGRRLDPSCRRRA